MPRDAPPDLFEGLADFEVEFFVNLVRQLLQASTSAMRGFFFHRIKQVRPRGHRAPARPSSTRPPAATISGRRQRSLQGASPRATAGALDSALFLRRCERRET